VTQKKIRDIIQQMKEYEMSPNQATLHELVNLYINHAPMLLPTAINVMKEIGVYPDVKVFNMIIEMHCENKNVKLAEQTLEDLISSGIKPNYRTYFLLLDLATSDDISDDQRVEKYFEKYNELFTIKNPFNPNKIYIDYFLQKKNYFLVKERLKK